MKKVVVLLVALLGFSTLLFAAPKNMAPLAAPLSDNHSEASSKPAVTDPGSGHDDAVGSGSGDDLDTINDADPSNDKDPEADDAPAKS